MAVLQGALIASYVVVCLSRSLPASWSGFDARVTAMSAAIARTIDGLVIDSAINGLGLVVRGWGVMLRRTQSGAVRLHVLSAVAGIVAMLGYFLWR